MADPAPAPTYEIVIVAYRSRPHVEAHFAALPADRPIAVIDNSRGADGLAAVCAARPNTRHLDGPGRGFASGANLAARTSTFETLIFVNPDCRPTGAQLDALVADLAGDPELAAVSGITVTPDGRFELGVGGWEPTVRRAVVHAVGAHKLFPTAGMWATPVPGEPIELDWLGGACMAVPRRTFLDLGGFDESYFLYSEDVDFGRQARAAGLRVKADTDIIIPHEAGGSGDGPGRMARQRGASQVRYLRRYRGRWQAVAVRAVFTAGYALRIVLCLLRGRRPVAREHLAYLRGMWFGPPDQS